MPKLENVRVTADETGLRLDRWFRRHAPGLTHGRLEKLLRTGQIRIDGARAKAGHRVQEGQLVRVPPLPQLQAPVPKARPPLSARDKKFVQDLVLFRNADLIAINKPPGLAVQGGTRTTRHLDALLDGLREEGEERPRLVHRLDRDTSGVLVLARSAKAAAALSHAFRARETEKIYWALTAGVPTPLEGRIDLPLAKGEGPRGRERMAPAEEMEQARRAITDYAVVAHAGRQVAFVVLRPLTGRTHQLRAHLAALGTPILGDFKYGGKNARLRGDVPGGLKLHARCLRLRLPDGRPLTLEAPPPPHMDAALRFFGFERADAEKAFRPHGRPRARLPR
jgi:23S rRNA pseudouridine955/2504/2580 synthase